MQFKVAAVTENTNSFGLRGMVLISSDGTAYEVAANHLNVKNPGDVVSVPFPINWAKLGYELPRQLPKAPPEVIREVWKHN